MEYRLTTFLAVCEKMNFTRAAEDLHITQPAVSQHIRLLEEEYGTKLFLHEGKRIRLTPAGQFFRDTVIRMQNDENVLHSKLTAFETGKQIFKLGATRTIGEFSLETKLASYIKTHPEIELHFIVDNTEKLLHQIDEGSLQCAFVEGFFDLNQYDFARFRTENFLAVCSKNHLFRHKIKTVYDLADETLLLREPGSGTREILEQFLYFQNMRIENFHNIVQIDSMHVILKLLERDAGISFMYQMAASKGIQQGILCSIPLRGLPVQHELSLVWKRGSQYSKEYKALCQDFSKE